MTVCCVLSLKMFLQRYVLREDDRGLFVVIGPSALRGAKHRGIYLRHAEQPGLHSQGVRRTDNE